MKTSLGVWRFVGGGTYLQLLLFWSKSTQTFIHHPHSTYSSVSSTRPITLIRSRQAYHCTFFSLSLECYR